MLRFLADIIIRLAQRNPYSPIVHSDGTLYMGRWWLMPRWALEPDPESPDALKVKPWLPFSIRVHHIATADYDRHFHDHPFSFVSIILRGWYIESRPRTLDPCFVTNRDFEASQVTSRMAGSVAYRRCTDRHLIKDVPVGGAWTLVFLTRRLQWWGFYTPAGKVHWKDYYNASPTVARPPQVPTNQHPHHPCICHKCIEEHGLTNSFGWPLSTTQMILCPKCHNKRCPHASDHNLPCTRSNEPGQAGSIYQ